MSSVPYQENQMGENTGRSAKMVISLLIALGLYLFSINFPFYIVFEPQSAGWVL